MIQYAKDAQTRARNAMQKGDNVIRIGTSIMTPHQLLMDLWPQIHIKDISFYNVDVFNQCENNNALLMAVPIWQSVHPLLKIIPVDWDYSMPFGLMHAPEPSPTVQGFLDAVSQMFPGTK